MSKYFWLPDSFSVPEPARPLEDVKLLLTSNVPPEMVVAPVYVLAPERVSFLSPVLVSPPLPEITPE